MLVNMTDIHRYSFSTRRTTRIRMNNVGNVVAMTYNYLDDCLYFADNRQDNIQVVKNVSVKYCLHFNEQSNEIFDEIILDTNFTDH